MGTIDYSRAGHIGTITINRPESLNAMTDEMSTASPWASAFKKPCAATSAAHELAETICANAPLAVRVTKQNAYYARFLPPELAARFIRLNGARVNESQDIREGARAFAEKRKPLWQGR